MLRPSPATHWFQLGLLDLGIILVLVGVVISGTIQIFETLPTTGPPKRVEHFWSSPPRFAYASSSTPTLPARPRERFIAVGEASYTRPWFKGLLAAIAGGCAVVFVAYVCAARLWRCRTDATSRMARTAGASAGCVIFLSMLFMWAFTAYSLLHTNTDLHEALLAGFRAVGLGLIAAISLIGIEAFLAVRMRARSAAHN